jgi:lipoate-protein ligase A
MALDEFLLELACDTGLCSIRTYGWREPTLSLGYFQAYHDRESHAPSASCPSVRRKSGGGAILHDREITYCLTADLASLRLKRPELLYSIVHRAWIEAIRRQAPLPLALYGKCGRHCEGPDPPEMERPDSQPFLCFQRRSPWDVVLEDAKIIGSAQRRRRRIVLQHGSLLLDRSPAAPELPGLHDFTAQPLDPRKLVEDWLQVLCSELGIEPRHEPLAEGEFERINYWRTSIFTGATHRFRR